MEHNDILQNRIDSLQTIIDDLKAEMLKIQDNDEVENLQSEINLHQSNIKDLREQLKLNYNPETEKQAKQMVLDRLNQ